MSLFVKMCKRKRLKTQIRYVIFKNGAIRLLQLSTAQYKNKPINSLFDRERWQKLNIKQQSVTITSNFFRVW